MLKEWFCKLMSIYIAKMASTILVRLYKLAGNTNPWLAWTTLESLDLQVGRASLDQWSSQVSSGKAKA